MRVLLDECIDRRFARELTAYEVKTVPQMGWAGIKDGQLLKVAAQEFDALVTVDRNLPFEQNLAKFDLAVVVLKSRSNRLIDLKPLAPELLLILPAAKKGNATVISTVTESS